METAIPMIETLAFRYVAVGILLFLTILLIVILRHIRLERNSLKSSPPLHDKITSAKSEDPRSPNDISTYEDLYFKERYIKDRAAVYISGDTKRKILGVVRRIGSNRMTVTSYVENILRHHLETYRDEINALYEARNSGKLL